jgi:putative transcriptional regulator
MIRHHPSPELLLDYATGALDEAVGLVVAGHVALCPECQTRVRRLEAVGGALLAAIPPVAVSDRLRARTLAALEGGEQPGGAHAAAAVFDTLLPAPIRRQLDRPLAALPWKRVGRFYEEYVLPVSTAGRRVSLLRIPPGRAMPEHDHRGHEYTLVLAGSYRDEAGLFQRGDFDAKESGHTHRPVAGEGESCVCLVVLDAPVKLRGMLRLLNPFLRI